MPKRRLNIQTFAGLASPALDDEDVPLEGASFASGLDPTERPGRLRGFPEDEATGLGHPVKAQAMLDGGDTVVFWDGSNVRQITGAEDGIDGSSSLVDGGGGFSTPEQVQMTSDGERIYMARGDALPAKWIGKHRKANPSTTLGSGYQIEDAALGAPSSVSALIKKRVADNSEGESNFPSSLSYGFAISFEYDGFQEGPLSVSPNTFTGRGDRSVNIEVQWSEPGSDSQRITAIHVYAMEGIATVGDTPNETLERAVPRLIRRIEVDDSWYQPSTTGTDITGYAGWANDDFSVSSGSAYDEDYGEQGGEPDSFNNSILEEDIFPNANIQSVEVSYDGNVTINGGTASVSLDLLVRDASGNLIGGDSVSLGSDGTLNGTLNVSGLGSSAYKIVLQGMANSNTDNDGETATANISASVFADDGSGTASIKAHQFTWDATLGAPYEQRTGLAPTADQPQINYTVSAEHSGFHFVSGASVDGEDYGSYIFRSKAKRFSQFAWAQDYLNLDTKIHNLTSFNGRLWAFSQSTAYRIDANTLTVEREYKGKGALGHRSITRSPLGLFWVNEENLFLHDGRELRDVGGPIRAGDFQEVWANLSTTEAPMTWYDPQNNVLVVAFRCIQQNLTPANEIWMLHFPEERWTDAIPGPRWMHLIPPEAWSATSSLQESFLGADGVPYFSVGDDLYSFATASAKRPWEWVSKEITGGQPGIEKVFYHADIKGDTPASVSYKEDEGAWQTASLEATNENRSRWPVNSGAAAPPWKSVYHFRLKIEGAGGDEVSSVSFLIRPRSRTR